MEHRIDPERIHHGWDNALEPSLSVSSGDVVRYELLMAGHGQVREGDTFEQTKFDFDTLYNLLGPSTWTERDRVTRCGSTSSTSARERGVGV